MSRLSQLKHGTHVVCHRNKENLTSVIGFIFLFLLFHSPSSSSKAHFLSVIWRKLGQPHSVFHNRNKSKDDLLFESTLSVWQQAIMEAKQSSIMSSLKPSTSTTAARAASESRPSTWRQADSLSSGFWEVNRRVRSFCFM